MVEGVESGTGLPSTGADRDVILSVPVCLDLRGMSEMVGIDQVKARIRARLYQPVHGLAQMSIIAMVLALVAILIAVSHAH
jgi:hypothetical protein